METEYIDIYQEIRKILPFVILMEKIEFVIKLQRDTLTVLYSIFEDTVTVYKENQGAVSLAISLQMQPCTKHITIMYHHFQSFIVNSDVDIKHVDTMEQIADIFVKLLDSEFLYIYDTSLIVGR